MSNKLIIKNSFILYIRLIVTTFVGVLSSRFVLSALGISDYGLYNVVGGIVSMMAFVNTIMVSTTYRYIAYEQGKSNCNINQIFNISLSIHIAISFIVLFAAFTIGLYYVRTYLVLPVGKLPDAIFAFCFSILNTVCVIIGTPFQGLLIAREKFTVTVPIEISTKLLNLGLVFLLGYLPGNHLRIYVVFITFVHMLNPILYIIYSLRNYFADVKWKLQRQWDKYREMMVYSGWIMFGAAASVGENQGSAMIINRFYGTVLNASFGVASQVNSMVSMFARSLNQAVVPQITKSYSSGNDSRSYHLVNLLSKYSFFLMLIPILPILLETDFILNVWLKQVPQYTKIFVQVILLKSLIVSMQAGIPTLVQASGKIKFFQITSSFIMLLCLPMAYVAFRLGYPPYTISFIYMFTSMLMFIVTIVMLKIILNYDVKRFLQRALLKMIPVIICTLPLFLISRYFGYGLPRFLVSLVVSEIVLVTAIYFLGTEASERRSLLMYGKLASNKLKRQ